MFLQPAGARVVVACAAAALLAVMFSVDASDRGEARRAHRADHTLGADRFMAGERVLVRTPVAGDLIAAGGEVDVTEAVGGDAVLAGGRVALDAPASRDLYAAGGRVGVRAPVARNARIAGGSVQVGPQARIGGGASIAGGRVQVLGAVDQYLQVAGGRVYIDAKIGGDVEATGGEIELGPNARVGGRLAYASEEDLIRHPDAQIQGEITRLPFPDYADDLPGIGFLIAAFLVWTLGLMLLGAVLVVVFPRLAARVSANAREHPGWSLAAGFIALVVIPFAAGAAAATVIGLPLALLTVLLYLALLLVGYVAAGISLGDAAIGRWGEWRAGRASWRALAAALAILALALISVIPFLGQFIALLALIVGIGAILLQLRGTGAKA